MDSKAHETLYKLILDIAILNEAIDRRIFSKHGIRRVRFYALMALYENKGLTLGELSDVVLIGRASASRMVFSMEQDGLVTRSPDPNDRRLFNLTLTPKGEALYHQVKSDLDLDIAERFNTFNTSAIFKIQDGHEQLKQALEAHIQCKQFPQKVA